jgi:hypothetical protein
MQPLRAIRTPSLLAFAALVLSLGVPGCPPEGCPEGQVKCDGIRP